MMKRLTHVFLTATLVIAYLRAVGTRYLNEDLYLGFCSGRDILNGFMGKPDQWSFNTDGRIWVDSSWLSYLIYYVTYLKLGYIGPVLIKAVLLAVALTVVYFRCTTLKISPFCTLLGMILATLSVGPFLIIRGDNFALLYLVVLVTLLTGKPAHRRSQQVGAAAVMALWANGHGSFPYGFYLILARFAVSLLPALGGFSRFVGWLGRSAGPEDSNRKQEPDGSGGTSSVPQGSEIKGWFLTVLASGIVAALLNPYGMDRLVQPVRRTMAESFIITFSADWSSVWQSLSAGGLTAASAPFVAFVVLLVLAGMLAVACDYSLVRSRIASLGRPVFFMLVLAALPITVMAFKYQRLIVLASFALVPLSTFVFDFAVSAARGRIGKGSDSNDRSFWALAAVGTLVFVCFLGFHFYRSMVIRYLPGNPFRVDRPLAHRLMTFPAYTMNVCAFMKRNHLAGRVFAGWDIGTLALLENPDIQVFMDCRDSAFYNDETMRAFLEVLYSNAPDRDARAASILKDYGVDFVLVTTHQLGFAEGLMKTKQWVPLYVDDEAILLTDRAGPIGRQFSRADDFAHLQWPDASTRIVTESLACLFSNGTVPAELVCSLKQLVRQRPQPILYSLIAADDGRNGPCDSQEPTAFLKAELERLMALPDAGLLAGEVVQSRIRILSLLSKRTRKDRNMAEAALYVAMKQHQGTILKDLMDRYY